MKKFGIILTCLLLAALTTLSCKKGGVRGIRVDNFSNGKAGEVILVLDKKYASESLLKYLDEFLSQAQPGLNQEEEMFDILQFENKDLNAQFQRHRSIIQFDMNPNFSSNTFKIEENVWARPQVHIYLRGNNMDSLAQLFMQHEDEILKRLYDNDLKRVQYFYSTNNNSYIEKIIKEKFGINITIPNTYNIAREEADFLWLRFKTVRNDRFIIIYRTHGSDLSRKGLIEARNEKTKAYIPGALPGSYPIVAEVYQFPLYNNHIKVGSTTGAELRGLWESEGDKMGGPFYHYSFLDPSGENVISVGGFVYAPEEEKRDYLREVEAIVKSVK
jgi:hypothetical protein